MEEGARSLARLGAKRDGSRNLGQLRRLAAYLRPYRGHVVGALLALVLASAAVLSLGHRPAPPDRRRLLRAPPRRARPRDRGRRHRHRDPGGRDLPALLSGHLAGRARRRRPAARRLPPRPPSVARLLRGHPHGRGAVAPDHRHQRHPDRDRRQRHPGAAQRAPGRGRPRPAGGDQPQAHRLRPGRGAAGGGADRGDRPARAPPVARHPGPHGRRLGRGRGDHQRHPHGPVLRPGGPRERPLRRRHRGRVRRRRPLCPGPGAAGGDHHHAGVRRHHRRALAGRPRRPGRPDHRRRAVGVRVLRHRRRQRLRRPQRHLRRPAARGRRHRAAVRAAGRAGRRRGPGQSRRRCRPHSPGALSLPGRQLRLSRRTPTGWSWATSTSTSARARPWPWSARPAPARPASSSS